MKTFVINGTVCLIALLLAFIPAINSMAQTNNYTLSPTVIAGGGMNGSGGSYSLNGTIRQPAVGASSSPTFSATTGFWSAVTNTRQVVAADFDGDRKTDLSIFRPNVGQ